MEIKGNWSLFFEDPATGVAHTVPAQVPGNVIGDLHRAGIIPDPFFGSNSGRSSNGNGSAPGGLFPL